MKQKETLEEHDAHCEFCQFFGYGKKKFGSFEIDSDVWRFRKDEEDEEWWK